MAAIVKMIINIKDDYMIKDIEDDRYKEIFCFSLRPYSIASCALVFAMFTWTNISYEYP